MKEKHWALILNRNQLAALKHATEMYARLSAGQFGEITNFRDLSLSPDLGELSEKINQIGKLMRGNLMGTGLATILNSPGIVSWDLYEVIRKALYDADGRTDYSVEGNPPLRFSEEPLPHIQEVNGVGCLEGEECQKHQKVKGKISSQKNLKSKKRRIKSG